MGNYGNKKTDYTYDFKGNITEIVYPTSLNDGITSIKFEYNEYNWITGIKAKINSVYKELRDYSYNSDGTINNIKDYTYDTNSNVNGYILKKYTYDNFGRVSSMKYYNSDSDTVKESYTYTYDKNSNIKSESIVNNYPTKDSDKVDEKREYNYNELNRLISSDIVNNKTNKTESYVYEYDEVGNMTSKANILSDSNKNNTVYTYNDLNQLVSSETSNLSTGKTTSKKTYSYDENGNNIKEVDSIKNITKEMTYDVDNRLDTYTQTENNKTTTQSNLYNGNGQRIQKSEGDNTINYYYQNGNVLYTTDKDEKKTSHNFVGLEGNIISTMRYDLTGLEYYVYNKDIKGSTTNIVDNNKNAKISYKYSDFGETEEFGDTDFYNEIAYTGGIYDKSTSLYYLNARYYNPEDARFITQDTYRGEKDKPETLHLYVYCANNPINYVDPSGHKKQFIGAGIQVSLSASSSYVDAGIGMEIIYFFKQIKKGVYAYWYGEFGTSFDKLKKARNKIYSLITKNPTSLLSKPSFSCSISLFAIQSEPKNTDVYDYEGKFKTVAASFIGYKGFISTGSGFRVVGAGKNFGNSGISGSVSNYHYYTNVSNKFNSLKEKIKSKVTKYSKK